MNSEVNVSCVMLLFMVLVCELFIGIKRYANMYYPSIIICIRSNSSLTLNHFRYPKKSFSETASD